MSKYKSRKPQEPVLSEEVAQEQLQELIDYYDIDPEKLGDAADSFEQALDEVVRQIGLGVLEVGRDKAGKLTVTHHLQGGTSITYGEVDAKAKLAMDKFDRKENYRRIYSFMGSLCGLGSGAIEKLHVKDLSVVEILGTVFSNV